MTILYRLAKLCAILRHPENEPAYYEPLRERDFEAAILPLREPLGKAPGNPGKADASTSPKRAFLIATGGYSLDLPNRLTAPMPIRERI